ncbi:MAG: hypothetical protein LBR68_07870 [Lachnoclostridium sp.]|nr:hypothetical protein [Lachnoclostridium sp.]
MAIMNEDYSLFFYDHPMVPSLAPVMGIGKMMEQENDISYLKYLYPHATKKVLPQIEEECDKLEYEGSPMFDEYPDKTFFQLLAYKIVNNCTERDPDLSERDTVFRDMVEVLLFHEVIFRRNRYRNHRRMYF